MKFSPTHLHRYQEIARLLWKYGRSDLVRELGVDESSEAKRFEPTDPAAATPEHFADDLEAMGPTYVKLAQIISSRPDLLPEPYLVALARLQDNVKPFSFAEVEEIVSTELGVRISKAFSRFDEKPVAAASLGQVHLAALRNGRPVVVKVQRPHIAKQISEDFEVLTEIAEFLDNHTEVGRRHHFLAILEEFRVSIQQELNYEREAQNLVMLGKSLQEFPLIDVPQPIPDYCSRRVLTMEQVQGRKITALGPLERLELEGAPLAAELFRAYLKQVLVDGLFHADPHPGNVFVTREGHIALLDLGMVGHTTPAMQNHLLKLLLAISEGNGDQAADLVIGISQTRDDFNAPEFRRRIGQFIALRRDQGLENLKIGKSILEVTQNAADNGLYVPSELTLLGKTLLQLDEVGRILDPAFDPNAYIRQHVSELMTRRMRKQATPGSLLGSLLEMKDFVGGLPTRINRVMDRVGNDELEVKIRAVDAQDVMNSLQKIANRITSGIVLAALIMGAATLTQTGYKGPAILCFLGAATGGFWLLITIFIQDRERPKTPPRK